ncbi:11456_t:CDS:2, partial [Gigaspora margarita]
MNEKDQSKHRKRNQQMKSKKNINPNEGQDMRILRCVDIADNGFVGCCYQNGKDAENDKYSKIKTHSAKTNKDEYTINHNHIMLHSNEKVGFYKRLYLDRIIGCEGVENVGSRMTMIFSDKTEKDYSVERATAEVANNIIKMRKGMNNVRCYYQHGTKYGLDYAQSVKENAKCK